jgi:hypothetical protein
MGVLGLLVNNRADADDSIDGAFRMVQYPHCDFGISRHVEREIFYEISSISLDGGLCGSESRVLDPVSVEQSVGAVSAVAIERPV